MRSFFGPSGTLVLTLDFIVFRRGELRSPAFITDNRLFSGVPRGSPTGWVLHTEMRSFSGDS